MIKKKKKVSKPKSKLAAVRERFNKSGGGSTGNIDWLKIPEPQRGERSSKVRIRVLPGRRKYEEFYHSYGLHYGFRIGGRNAAIPCSESVGKGTCHVCTLAARMDNSGDRQLGKIAQRIRANTQYWVNVVSRDDDKVYVLSAKRGLIETILDEDDEGNDVLDVESGSDITIVRTGRGMKTRYKYRVAKESSSVEYNEKELTNLEKEIVNEMTEAQIIEALQNNFGGELKEVGLKLKKSKKSKTSSKKKVKDEEDDDINDDEEDEEDIEETEEAEEDNENEDDDSDEDEEDEVEGDDDEEDDDEEEEDEDED